MDTIEDLMQSREDFKYFLERYEKDYLRLLNKEDCHLELKYDNGDSFYLLKQDEMIIACLKVYRGSINKLKKEISLIDKEINEFKNVIEIDENKIFND